MQLLIIGDEDLFVEALGRFSSSAYSIAFAADLAEAEAQIEACKPTMVVVAEIADDGRLAALLERARHQHGTVRIGLGQQRATELFDHTIAATEAAAVLDHLEQLAGELSAAPGERTLQEQVAQQARDLKALEKRLTDVALGTTGGLSELVVSMDGVQQALKLHMRLIKGLAKHSDAPAEGQPPVGAIHEAQKQLESKLSNLSEQLSSLSEAGKDRAGAPDAEELKARVQNQSQDLKSLEQRISELVIGTTGGLTELIEASDGVQQALKLHARQIRELEARIDNEVIPLRTTVVEMGNQVMALRRDLRAMERSMSGDLPPDFAEDLVSDSEMMFEPLDVDVDDEPAARSSSSPAAKPPAE